MTQFSAFFPVDRASGLRVNQCIMPALRDRVATPEGDVIVTTKTRFYLFFKRPRTYVVPEGFSGFGGQLGFAVRYNTCDPKILAELHKFYVDCIALGAFQPLLYGAKTGIPDYFPPHDEHLKKYIIGFNA